MLVSSIAFRKSRNWEASEHQNVLSCPTASFIHLPCPDVVRETTLGHSTPLSWALPYMWYLALCSRELPILIRSCHPEKWWMLPGGDDVSIPNHGLRLWPRNSCLHARFMIRYLDCHGWPQLSEIKPIFESAAVWTLPSDGTLLVCRSLSMLPPARRLVCRMSESSRWCIVTGMLFPPVCSCVAIALRL